MIVVVTARKRAGVGRVEVVGRSYAGGRWCALGLTWSRIVDLGHSGRDDGETAGACVAGSRLWAVRSSWERGCEPDRTGRATAEGRGSA